MLYFVNHTDPRLGEFYLFTDEKEPNMFGSYLCFLMERKTLQLGGYKGQDRVQVKSKYVKKLTSMEDFPVEEHFNDNRETMRRFLSTMKLILRNI